MAEKLDIAELSPIRSRLCPTNRNFHAPTPPFDPMKIASIIFCSLLLASPLLSKPRSIPPMIGSLTIYMIQDGTESVVAITPESIKKYYYKKIEFGADFNVSFGQRLQDWQDELKGKSSSPSRLPNPVIVFVADMEKGGRIEIVVSKTNQAISVNGNVYDDKQLYDEIAGYIIFVSGG